MLKIGKNKKGFFKRVLVLGFIVMVTVSNFGLKPVFASAGLGDKLTAEVIFLEHVIKVSTPWLQSYNKDSNLYRPWADASQISKIGPYYNKNSIAYNCILDPTSVFYNPDMDPTQVSDHPVEKEEELIIDVEYEPKVEPQLFTCDNWEKDPLLDFSDQE